MTGYPDEPWHLAGTAHLTLWRVPVGALPVLPASTRPLAVRGRALVVTAFVAYSPAGVLAYDELLAAVAVRHGRGPAVSVTDIWVDSPASRTGGRELWGIPKELADFDGLAACLGGRAVARADFAARRAPAVPLPALGGRVVQTRHGRTVASPVRASARVRPARATWELPADGALAWLRAGRPVVSAVAEDVRMRFGSLVRTR